MKQYDLSLDPRLSQKLDIFRAFPARDPQAAAQGRANFLSIAQSISQGIPEEEARSIQTQVNPLHAFSRLFERLPSPALFATALILSVLLLASVATVFAAQGSLPGQPLYAVKTLSEETRLALSSDPEAKINLALDFADRRITELPTAAQIGSPQLDATLARLQQQLNRVLQMAASLDDDHIIPALQHIRQMLQEQEQVLLRMQAQEGPRGQAVLTQARWMVQTRLQLVENGLVDPQAFRNQVRQQQFSPNGGNPPGPQNNLPGANGSGSGSNPNPESGNDLPPDSGSNSAPNDGANPAPQPAGSPGGSTAPGPGSNQPSTNPGQPGSNPQGGDGGGNDNSGGGGGSGNDDGGSAGGGGGSGSGNDSGGGGGNPSGGGSDDRNYR